MGRSPETEVASIRADATFDRMQYNRVGIFTIGLLFSVSFTACDNGDDDSPGQGTAGVSDNDDGDSDKEQNTATDDQGDDSNTTMEDSPNGDQDDSSSDDEKTDTGENDSTDEDDDSSSDDSTDDTGGDTETDEDAIDCSMLTPTGKGIGDVPENVQLQDADGNLVGLHDYCNHVIYAITGTGYCSHCNEEARRAAKLVTETYPDGRVKAFFLLSADQNGNPSTLEAVKAWEEKFDWRPHGMGLNDPKLEGFNTLFKERPGKDGSIILKPGFIITAIDSKDPEADVEAALAESE